MVAIHQYRFLLTALTIFLLLACSANARAIPEISWDFKLATPGAQIKFEKQSESSYYVMWVSGLPKDKHYVLWTKWIDGRTWNESVPDTNALFEGKSVFTYHHVYRGEPLDYAIISSDQAVRAYAQIIPYPLEAIGEGGCKLSVTLLSPNGRLFAIIGEGFKPSEQVATISKSESEILSHEAIALKDGRIAAYVDPGVVGKTGGSATFQALSKTCDVTIRYEWGTAMKMIGE